MGEVFNYVWDGSNWVPESGSSGGVPTVSLEELPTAAALADNTANPITSLIGSCLMAFDGTTWDRVQIGAGTAAAAARTTLASDDPAVTSLAIIDDWDEGDRAKVNLITGQSGITGNAGVVQANTPRITLASDDPAVTSLQLIDDSVFTDDTTTFTPGTTKGFAIGGCVDDTSTDTADEGDMVVARYSSRRAAMVSLDTTISGEDQTTGVMKVEERYTATRVAADTLIKSGSGFIHTLNFSASGTVTAGVITVYDNTAESGTIIWTGTINVATNPVLVIINGTFSNGLYVGYDGTIANVSTTVSWR